MSCPIAFSIRDGRIAINGDPVIKSADASFRVARITAILGPSGTGKSALLQCLAGRQRQEIESEGDWLLWNRPVTEAADGELLWVPQRPAHRHAAPRPVGEGLTISDAIALTGKVLLLDEPDRGVDDAGRSALEEELATYRDQGGTVLMITHDLELARRVADDVCFVVAGEIAYCGAAETFFAAPPLPMVERFLQQGNCWPGEDDVRPDLPEHFRWVFGYRLGGMGRPGLLSDADADLTALATRGVTRLVTLTERPLEAGALVRHGIQPRHFPIPDMGVPSKHAMARLCGELERALAANEVIVLHCHAGLGRTGLALAALLIWMGARPDDAIAQLRRLRRGYVQSDAQVRFLRCFDDL